MGADHGELYDEGEEIEGAVLNGLTENLHFVAPSIEAVVWKMLLAIMIKDDK